MTSKNQYSPPRKGPNVEAELDSLYRRRAMVDRLIRSMKAYVRACREEEVSPSKAA